MTPDLLARLFHSSGTAWGPRSESEPLWRAIERGAIRVERLSIPIAADTDVRASHVRRRGTESAEHLRLKRITYLWLRERDRRPPIDESFHGYRCDLESVVANWRVECGDTSANGCLDTILRDEWSGFLLVPFQPDATDALDAYLFTAAEGARDEYECAHVDRLRAAAAALEL